MCNTAVQGLIICPKILEPPQNSRCQISSGGDANFRAYCTKFSVPRALTTEVYASLLLGVDVQKVFRNTLLRRRLVVEYFNLRWKNNDYIDVSVCFFFS